MKRRHSFRYSDAHDTGIQQQLVRIRFLHAPIDATACDALPNA